MAKPTNIEDKINCTYIIKIRVIKDKLIKLDEG
jgi:hypothetical protein